MKVQAFRFVPSVKLARALHALAKVSWARSSADAGSFVRLRAKAHMGDDGDQIVAKGVLGRRHVEFLPT
jgi:hypothetical protein